MEKLFYEFGRYYAYVISIIAIIAFFSNRTKILSFLFLFSAFQVNLFSKPLETGFFEPHLLIGVLVIFLLFVRLNLREDYSELPQLKRTIIKFALFTFFFIFFVELKNYALFDILVLGWKEYIKIVINLLCLLLIILRADKLKLNKYIEMGIIFGAIFISIQTLFSDVFLKVSFFHPEIIEGARTAGYVKMDENEYARLLLVVLAYCITRIRTSQNKLYYMIPIITTFYGILLTGSRAGFILSFFLIFPLIFTRNKNKTVGSILSLIVISALAYNIFNLFGNTAINRLTSINMLQDIHVKGWIEYMSYLLSNPLYLLTGALRQIRGIYSTGRPVHNIYIQMIYNLGIFYLIFYITFFYKFLKLNKVDNRNFSIFLPVIAFLAFSFTISSMDSGYLLYIIALSSLKDLQSNNK